MVRFLSLFAVFPSLVGASCDIGQCMGHAQQQQQAKCHDFRYKTPSPDLYTRCNDGFSAGLSVSCARLCTNEFTDQRDLLGMASSFCREWTQNAQRSYLAACVTGYAYSVTLAVEYAAENFIREETHVDVAPDYTGYRNTQDEVTWSASRDEEQTTVEEMANQRLRQARAQALSDYADE